MVRATDKVKDKKLSLQGPEVFYAPRMELRGPSSAGSGAEGGSWSVHPVGREEVAVWPLARPSSAEEVGGFLPALALLLGGASHA